MALEGGMKPEVGAVDSAFTPVQEEIASQTAEKQITMAFGTVERCDDSEHSGKIKVKCAAFPKGAEWCDYVSPIG